MTSRTPTVSAALRKCLDASFAQALALGHNYVGAEHLLLGVIHERNSPAARSLAAAGLTLQVARSTVQSLISDYLRARH